jgi:acetolactate synthase small subunit
MRQVIQLWVEDKPGVLMRVAGIITAKGANIYSLALAPDPPAAPESVVSFLWRI